MFKLKRNMGTGDRTARTVVGVALLVVGPLTDIVATDLMSNVLLSGLAVIALSSATVSFCPFYVLTGFNTARKQP